MAVTVSNIIASKEAEGTQVTQYTSPDPGIGTIIDKFTADNTSAGPLTLSVNLVTKGDTAGNQNLIVKTKSLLAGQTYLFPEIVGQTLDPGDFISTIASAGTGMTIRASGRIVT